MIVHVLQKHIDVGRKNQKAWIDGGININGISEICPIALALKEFFCVSYAQATAWKLQIGLFPDNLIFNVPTPLEVAEFIHRFDRLENVEPFQFEIDKIDL